jgi:hypothetical protein
VTNLTITGVEYDRSNTRPTRELREGTVLVADDARADDIVVVLTVEPDAALAAEYEDMADEMLVIAHETRAVQRRALPQE